MEKKEVEMQTDQSVKKKFSYEDLENVCHQLSEQARALYQKLQETDMSNLFKRLDYLFAVVENISKFPAEFGKKCIEEIVSSMTIPEKPIEEESKEK